MNIIIKIFLNIYWQYYNLFKLKKRLCTVIKTGKTYIKIEMIKDLRSYLLKFKFLKNMPLLKISKSFIDKIL